MDRRSAIATAGAVTLVIAAAGLALAANVGLLKSSDQDTVGKLSTADTSVAATLKEQKPQVITIYVDDPPKVQPAAPQEVREIVVTETQSPDRDNSGPSREREDEDDEDEDEHEEDEHQEDEREPEDGDDG